MVRLATVHAALLIASALVPASAQSPLPVTSITYAGCYDVATQNFHPSQVDPDLAPGDSDPTVLYDNTATNNSVWSGWLGTITSQHFMDWGTPEFLGAGAVVTEIRIGYATYLKAPEVVALRIRLYSDATGFGVQGEVIGDYLLTGLPNSISGQYEGFLIDVALPEPLDVPDGALGWSYNSDSSGPASGTAVLLVGPPVASGVVDAYDEYDEATEAYGGSFWFFGNPFASFFMRLEGRVNPPIFENYGTGNGPTLTAEGSATPGSTDNVLHLKASIPGKNVILVAGLAQSDVFHAGLGLQLYAFPWLVQLAPLPTSTLSGKVDLAAPFDPGLQPGDEIFVQIFSQNVADEYVKWSPGLKITVQ